MLEMEFEALLLKCQKEQCEGQTLEVKSAHTGCPERLYDTFSSFSNQEDGGTILFGVEEQSGFQEVGVYDAQDLQKKLMEVGEAMTPVVRPLLTVYERNGLIFVAAEIPPVDLSERPCFKTSKGRLKGSYLRVGDGDKPMTEYEVYSYEAFRRKCRDDIRVVEAASQNSLDQVRLEQYLLQKKLDRPNLASLPLSQLYELTGILHDEKPTLSAILLLCPYPQAYFPQLGIIASRVPGKEMGELNEDGRRFTDSQRVEGTLPEMLEGAMAFLQKNLRTSVRIDPVTGKRTDCVEYPMDALREVILNALVHRDYSVHTENMPIQLTLFSDRIEVRNPGGLYGRLTVDQLGKAQPDTRNPFLVTAMEALGKTENRYSGIPRIRRAMKEAGLPEPVFRDSREEFFVCLYNGTDWEEPQDDTASSQQRSSEDPRGILKFCKTPRTRKEIAEFLGVSSFPYAMKKYIEPLIQQGKIQLSIPGKPRSSKQTYQTKASPEK